MLDDLDLIARFDSDNALAVAAGQPEQLNFRFQISDFRFHKDDISNVVLTGMGGSALAGLLVRSWLDGELDVPFVVTRNYELPAFVTKNTLVIASSYSGNTEETLSAVADAQKKDANIVVVSSGGKLSKLAKTKGYGWLEIPPGYQPRMAVWFGVRLVSAIFEELGLAKKSFGGLKRAADSLAESAKQYVPQSPMADNQAKKMAVELAGKTPVIYGSPLLASAAYKWKINFNENAKNLAFCNELPEFNHNEFIGWSSHPVEKPFSVIELSSSFDKPQIDKRYKISNKLLSGKMPKPLEVKAEGKSKIEQILWTVQLGDFVSIYLAILNQVNPTPVELVEKLKKTAIN